METRAKHITIGAFVLSSVLAIAFFVFWLARFEGEVRYYPYFVRFSGSVSQLRVDSTVLFGGIPVGRVIDVRIDPENSELARVDFAIREGTPIRVDSRATLELQGITGGVVVQISRGTSTAALLAPGSEITAGPSALEQIVRRVPDLLTKIDDITQRMSDLLSDQNRQAFSNSLANLERITQQLVGGATSAEGVMTDASGAIQELNNAAKEFSALAVELRGTVGDARGDVTKAAKNFALMAESFNRTSKQLSAVIDDNREPLKQFSATTLYETGELVSELRGTVGDARGDVTKAAKNFALMAESFNWTSKQLSAVIDDNREPLKQFSATTLYETGELVSELRRLVASMTRISNQFEKDPARFLLNDRSTGVDTP